jgi:hypothetical protein
MITPRQTFLVMALVTDRTFHNERIRVPTPTLSHIHRRAQRSPSDIKPSNILLPIWRQRRTWAWG